MPSVVSQALRSWKSAPAVAALAAVALGLGIGCTTAIYTVVNSVMLKPLPYPHAGRLVALYASTFSQPELRGSSSYPDLLEYQQRTHSFDMFGWFKVAGFNLTSPGPPQHIAGLAVTPSLVNDLGVNPAVGQWFHDETGAVISHSLWQRLGAKKDILGTAVTLDNRVYSITGVMPATFRLPVPGPGIDLGPADIWVYLDPHGRGENPEGGWFFCYARRKPGVSFSQAEQDVKNVASQIARKNPGSHPSYTARLDGLRDAAIADIRPTLILLFAASGLLLLITCANVGGLLLARAVARARETALRVALGASRRQLALLYFSEGLLVSLAGAAIGVVLSLALVRLIVTVAADFIPRADEIAVDWTVFLFAAGTAVAASAISSLAPLWQAARTESHEVLSDGVRTSAGMRSRRLSQSLVVAEIGLAFTLLSVSGVLISHWIQLTRVHPGFDPDRLLTFQLNVPPALASDGARRNPYEKRLTGALQAIAGVSSVAITNQLPLSCCFSTLIYPEGRVADPASTTRVSFLTVNPEYWRTMRIPLRSGRLLNDGDTGDAPLMVVINQAAASIYWPHQNPVAAYGHISEQNGSRFQVVGVVGDVRNEGLDRPTVPEIYLPASLAVANPVYFLVRSSKPSETLIPEVRRAIQQVDPLQAIYSVATMNQIARQSVSLQRVGSFMLTFFAVAALAMATLGIYGVVSYSVRQRTVEIGTRMALGAIGRDVLTLVLGGGVRMAAYGVGIGGVAVIAAAWVLVRSFQIHDLGAAPFLFSAAIVAAISLAASFFPAWRATLLSPMVAIRNQPESLWETASQSVWQMFRGISEVVSAGNAEARGPGEAVLTEFAQAARGAGSFPEAFQIALDILCASIGAQSARLLENVSGDAYRSTTASPRELAPLGIPAHGFLVKRLKFHAYPMPLSAGDFDTWLRWAHESKPEYLAELETLQSSGAALAAPLRAKNEIVGVLLLGPPSDRAEYTGAEKQLLSNCADQLALMIENSRLTGRVLEEEKLRRDLDLAAEVQKRLLPERAPDAGTAQLAAFSLPARTVGGDYYDFLELGGGRIGIALADIAGKGIAAALLMSVVQASLRVIAAEGDASLPELAARLNRLLHRSTKSNSYATFFYAHFDPGSLRLNYVNAGHNPPYVVREGAEIEELGTGGTVLGLFPEVSYEEAAVDLRPGDVLAAFTDGVTEALNPKEEEFGEERLKDLLRGVVHLPVEEIRGRMVAELKKWMQDAAQHDDLTFIVLKVTG